jgi:hypothetical protein
LRHDWNNITDTTLSGDRKTASAMTDGDVDTSAKGKLLVVSCEGASGRSPFRRLPRS